MDTQALLEQILKSGQQMLNRGQEIAEEKLNIPEQGAERDAMLSGLGKGALIAGGLAALLGTRAGRRLTGGTLKLGGLATIGGLAYQTYQKWQQENAEQPTISGDNKVELNYAEAHERSRLLVKAMVAAAKADGQIDSNERSKINQQIKELGLDDGSAEFIANEIEKPLDVQEIASEIKSPEAAAEIYLVSRAIIDIDNAKERAYIEELAKALSLPPELIAELNNHVKE